MSVLKRSKPQIIAVLLCNTMHAPKTPRQPATDPHAKTQSPHTTHASNEAYAGVRPRPAAIGQPQRRPSPQQQRQIGQRQN